MKFSPVSRTYHDIIVHYTSSMTTKIRHASGFANIQKTILHGHTTVEGFRKSNFKELTHQNPKKHGITESKLTGQFMVFSLLVQSWNDFSMTM